MKKQILLITGIVILLRIIIITIFKDDPIFFLAPRNLNGRGVLVSPVWIDFLIPILAIIVLRNKTTNLLFDIKKLLKPLLTALTILTAPLLTGILLSNYIQKSLITFEFNSVFLFRYLLYVLTFIAINVFADKLKNKSKTYKYGSLFLFIMFVACTQDIFSSGNTSYMLLALFSSVGVSTAIIVLGMRKSYKSNPVETVVAVSLTGLILIFFIYNILSVSYFTIFLPFLTMFVTALVFYKNWKLRSKIIIVSLPFLLAVFLNTGLPLMVSPEFANRLIERKEEKTLFESRTGDVVVKYNSQKLKSISIKFAKVIDAANKICKQEFGFSPEVKELIIKGIAPGGFHAEFPNRIVGNIMSEKFIENCSDSTFLNNWRLLPDFPDPVNSILHEYSHLLGVIPYHKWWPGAEEEGWATFSATVLSKLLYNKYGKTLWQPAYDYNHQANMITKLNLSEKAVVWSHPNEYGGFILWYNLAGDYGLKKLYNMRWNISKHNINGSLYYYSNPGEAKKVVELFGYKKFKNYGNTPKKPFNVIYSLNDYLYLAKTTGIDTGKIIRLYNFLKNRIINPTIPLP